MTNTEYNELEKFILDQYKTEKDNKYSYLEDYFDEVGISYEIFEKTKNNHTKHYPEFIEEILITYPDYDYIFLDRDARPIYNVFNWFKKIRNLDNEGKIIAINRFMIKELYKKIQKEKEIETIDELIKTHVKKNKYSKTLLN